MSPTTATPTPAAAGNTVVGNTIAISLSAVLHYLYTHPEKMQKLRDEIDGMAKKGQVSDPVTLKETQARG